MLNRIKELREAAGLTQTQLGDLIGTTGVSISRYEKQWQRVSLPILQQIADALGVRPVDIISDTSVEHFAAARMLKLRGSRCTVMFDRALLEEIAGSATVEAILIEDDAMDPTLAKGAMALVDVSHTSADRDGLYLIQIGAFEAVRRINVQLNGALRVSTDNTRRGSDMMARPEEVTVLGRVLWVGGRV